MRWAFANLVIWPKLYERQRRVIPSAGMMAVHGRIQREGEVVHLVAHRVTDLSDALTSVGGRDTTFPCRIGAAISFATAARDKIRASSRQKAWTRTTPPFPIFTSIRSR